MKNLLFALISLLLVSCSEDCPPGYGPANCSESFASLVVGTHTGTSCNNEVILTAEEINATQAKFNGQYIGVFTDWNKITIAAQTYQHPITGADITISGAGSIVENPTPIGQNSRFTLNMALTYTTQGQQVYCSESYNL